MPYTKETRWIRMCTFCAIRRMGPSIPHSFFFLPRVERLKCAYVSDIGSMK